MLLHKAHSDAVVGSQKPAIKSVTFVWQGGETLGTFWHGGSLSLHPHISLRKLVFLEAMKHIFRIVYAISTFLVVDVV